MDSRRCEQHVLQRIDLRKVRHSKLIVESTSGTRRLLERVWSLEEIQKEEKANWGARQVGKEDLTARDLPEGL